MKQIKFFWGGLLVAGVFMGYAQAQEEPMWRVGNKAPARVVPLFQGNANPFPIVADTIKDMPDPALLEKERLRQEAVDKANRFIQGTAGIEPDLSKVSFQGAILAPAGSRVLYQNKWLKAGDNISVGVKPSAEAYTQLSEVKNIDEKSANQLEDIFKTRIEGIGTVKVTIQAITSSSVILKTEGGTHNIPLPTGGNL